MRFHGNKWRNGNSLAFNSHCPNISSFAGWELPQRCTRATSWRGRWCCVSAIQRNNSAENGSSGGRELIRANPPLPSLFSPLSPDLVRLLARKLNSRVVREDTRVSTIVLKFKRATGWTGHGYSIVGGRAAVLKYLSDRDHLRRLRSEIRERYLARARGDGREGRKKK